MSALLAVWSIAEFVLSVIGALTLGVVAFVGVTTLRCRLRSGSWWWDEAAAGVDSGQ